VIEDYNVTNCYIEPSEPIPDTGDNYSYIFWIVLMGISLNCNDLVNCVSKKIKIN
jgi:hypothetical protein